MTHSFGFRQDHMMSFMLYAEIMNIDPRELYALSMVNCCTDCYKTGCGVSWTEYNWQVKDRPSRMTLAQKLFQAEHMLSDYLKTPVGPTYYSGEMHTVHFTRKRGGRHLYHGNGHGSYYGPDLRIQTRYRNVIKTGTQVLTPIGHDLPQTREFIDRRGWGFSDDIIYCIGTSEEPLLLSDLEDQDIDNLCNLRIYQPNFGPITDGCVPIQDADGNICYLDDWTTVGSNFYHGHRIRPFHASYSGSRLCIQINKTPNVRLELYSTLPHTGKGHLTDIDFCDEDSFPERMDVYNVSYEKPDGVAFLRKTPCACTYGCDACEMREVPICLEPIDPITGEFRVIPIEDTAELGEPCCWTPTTWSECCYDLYGDYNACGCDVPIMVCINYVASPCNCWDDCCIGDEVCPDFAPSLAYLASSLMPSICNCGCLDDLFSYYSMDLMMGLAGQRSGSAIFANEKGFVFGTTRGALEAYNNLRYKHQIIGSGQWFIG